MVEVPAGAAALATRVSKVALAEDPGLKDAVTPVGTPLAVKATVPIKPPVGATTIVADPLVRWAIVSLAGFAERV